MSSRPGRRAAILLVAIPLAIATSPACAQAGSASPADDSSSPFLGRWELDLRRLPDNYGAAPKRVTYAFADIGAGKWRSTIDVTDPDDRVRHMVVDFRRDGTAVRGGGDTSEADEAAFISPSPRVLIMNLAKERRPGSVRVYTVSDDGGEMTESAASVTTNGAPMIRRFHYRRLP